MYQHIRFYTDLTEFYVKIFRLEFHKYYTVAQKDTDVKILAAQSAKRLVFSGNERKIFFN